MTSKTFNPEYYLKIICLVCLAIIFSFVGELLNLPIPWLLIPLFVSVIAVFVQTELQSLPKSFNILGQTIVAVVTASRFSVDSFVDIKHYFFPLLLCIVVTSIFSLLNGYLIYKWGKLDIATSFLSCIPGASASLVAMSDEMGADTIAVAVLQSLRIVMVSMIMPVLASFYVIDNNLINITTIVEPELAKMVLPFPIGLLILSVVVIIGIKLGEKIKLPSNSFLAPFFACLIFMAFFPYQIIIPYPFFCGGLLLLGLSTGVRFESSIVKKLAKALFIDMFLLLLLIAICFLAGYEFHLITHIDTLSSLLGSTPGALNAMMATVIELGGDSSLVLTMQMSRMLLILIFIPFIGNTFLKKSAS